MPPPRLPTRNTLQRASAVAPVFAIVVWGIATAVGAGDYGLWHSAASRADVSVGAAPNEGSREIPSQRSSRAGLDWDADVSDLARVAAPQNSHAVGKTPVDFALSRSQAVGDPTLENPLRVVIEGEIGRGESLGYLLARQGVQATKVWVVERELRPVFNFRYAQPGDRYRLTQDSDGNVVDFRYTKRRGSGMLHLFRDGEGYTVQYEETQFVRRIVSIGGPIESTLYGAISLLGENPLLANDFAALFAWDVDFTRAVRAGDDFRILYERIYRLDHEGVEHYVRPGRILAARFRGRVGEFTALYFEQDDGRGGYFRPNGKSVEREFLVSPLEYGRITSAWSQARTHPILKVTRPHHGIDYAAPTGTPVWSVANGTVIYRGWGGGFGNLIKVRHANGYVSYYAHLSRFASGLKVGSAVSQKQVIGNVGSTGLSTGPHVCFRVARNGQYVNPLTLESPAGHPIPERQWMDFQVVRDTLLSDMDVRHIAALGEAL